ncbi:hypothetical protein DO72_861 [Burkholderia pseudomallei]|nr:hypothetical protein DO72_861 [Burkholderia pseudomallei]
MPSKALVDCNVDLPQYAPSRFSGSVFRTSLAPHSHNLQFPPGCHPSTMKIPAAICGSVTRHQLCLLVNIPIDRALSPYPASGSKLFRHIRPGSTVAKHLSYSVPHVLGVCGPATGTDEHITPTTSGSRDSPVSVKLEHLRTDSAIKIGSVAPDKVAGPPFKSANRPVAKVDGLGALAPGIYIDRQGVPRPKISWVSVVPFRDVVRTAHLAALP